MVPVNRTVHFSYTVFSPSVLLIDLSEVSISEEGSNTGFVSFFLCQTSDLLVELA